MRSESVLPGTLGAGGNGLIESIVHRNLRNGKMDSTAASSFFPFSADRTKLDDQTHKEECDQCANNPLPNCGGVEDGHGKYGAVNRGAAYRVPVALESGVSIPSAEILSHIHQREFITNRDDGRAGTIESVFCLEVSMPPQSQEHPE